MTTKVQCWCQHCKGELPPSHTGPCPHCGKTGKDCEATPTDTVDIEASMSETHKPKWSSESLALFFGILAVLLAVFVPGILMLLPFDSGVDYGMLVGFLIVMGFIFWWQRYRVLMLIRSMEGRFGGEKKF
jgi:hypothetical protein